MLFYFSTFAPSYAYLDPGGTSAFMQVIVAALAGAAASIGFYWQKVKNCIRTVFSSKKNKKN